MHPVGDDYPDVLRRTIAALLTDGLDACARELADIAYPPREIGLKHRPENEGGELGLR